MYHFELKDGKFVEVKPKKKSLLCKLGFHDWKTVKRLRCKVPVGNQFTGKIHGNVNGETVFQECQREGCNCVRGMVDIGIQRDQMDIGFLARGAIASNPSLASDSFLRECAEL